MRAEIALYDNYQECLFQIYPRLQYTALKKQKKDASKVEKREINLKRVEHEKEHNLNKIQ